MKHIIVCFTYAECIEVVWNFINFLLVRFYALINYVILTVSVSIYLRRIEILQHLSSTDARMENIQHCAKCLNVLMA